MNRNRLRRVLILLIAAALCLIMARVAYGGQRGAARRLSLWFSLTDCTQDAMESMLASCFRDTGVRIDATAYQDEEALGAAFETGRPDLLFCTQTRAKLLGGGGGLAAIADALPVPAALAEDDPAMGRSFFPIGARLPLLVVNRELAGADWESLEALLDAAAEGKPFLASDCWADVLYTAMSSLGETMRGESAEDAKSPAYTELYNRLALASFRGGLVLNERAAEYVRQGLLPCAAAHSTALAGFQGDALAVSALPLPEGGEKRYPAELMGIAVLKGADMETAEIFLNWLFDGRGSGTALSAGLVPLASDGAERGSDALTRLLLTLAESDALCLPGAEEPFFQNRHACERDLREALDLLA